MCDPDSESICLSCETDFYLNKAGGTKCDACSDHISFASGCFRCDANDCLECRPNYYMTTNASGNKICSPCQLDEFNAQYDVEPNRCSQCRSDDPKQCKVCDIGFLNSNSNPTSCELKCDDG